MPLGSRTGASFLTPPQPRPLDKGAPQTSCPREVDKTGGTNGQMTPVVVTALTPVSTAAGPTVDPIVAICHASTSQAATNVVTGNAVTIHVITAWSATERPGGLLASANATLEGGQVGTR